MALNGVDGVLVQRLIPVQAFSEGWRDHEVASTGNRNQTGAAARGHGGRGGKRIGPLRSCRGTVPVCEVTRECVKVRNT
jgi:hypothetical protein